MKRLVIGAAAAGGVAFAVRPLARKGRELHDRCRQMMRGRCRHSSAGSRLG